MSGSLSIRVKTATKWSTIGEIAARLVPPISSVVLARLLTPDAFGVVATMTMIITFAEIFTDAGFQKYIVQHEFRDNQDRDESINVAFWTNLVMSLVIWGVIAIFRNHLAAIVGNPGMGYVLATACMAIPLAAFSSIQIAIFKRDLDFKTLAKVRIISSLIPLFVTVPLAFWLRNYWALIAGTLSVNIANAVMLTVFSTWKPRWFYSFSKFKEMFSFTVWSMIEAITIWLTSYVDVFIVGNMLSQYYLGLYKTSSALVGQIMGLVTAVTTPVLFSALSRLQSDEKEFQSLFFRFQKLVGLLVMPLGMGLFIFRDFATKMLLGSQWSEAAGFVGLWGLTSAITIVLCHYSSEVYRAKGKPKLSVLAQLMHIIVLWPTVLIAVKYGFETLYVARSLVRIEMIVVNLCIMGLVIKMPVARMITNIFPSCVAATTMMLVLMFPSSEQLGINICYIAIAIIIYLAVIMFFRDERQLLFTIPGIIKSRR
ncbi:MAG: lipopolysaccharide biosynthesis protein [Bacteroidales bacterium]|nr:lipopolysaccharide biosynthesis protein [Bacteroidales bacterium]